MLRFAFWFALIWSLFLLLRRLLRGAVTPPRRSGPAPGEPRSGGIMVRDPVCNTYIPKNSARPYRGRDGQDWFFCSEECERKFLKQNGLAS